MEAIVWELVVFNYVAKVGFLTQKRHKNALVLFLQKAIF